MVIDDIKSTPEVGFSKIVYNFAGAYHYDTWAWAAVIFSGAFFLFFLGYYLGATTLIKRLFFVGMSLAVIAVAVCILSALFIRSAGAKERPAIVFEEVVSVKSEPNKTSDDAFILHEGTR